MFDETRFFTSAFDGVLATPFNSERGKRSPFAFANYATIVAAAEVLKDLNMELDFKPNEDRLILKERFLRGDKCFPIRVKGDSYSQTEENGLEQTVSYWDPDTTEDERIQKMGVIVIDTKGAKVTITRSDSFDGEYDSLVTHLITTISQKHEDGGYGVTRITTPFDLSSNVLARTGTSQISSVYYNKDFMAMSYFDSSLENKKNIYGDPLSVILSHMEARDITPDDEKKETIENLVSFSSIEQGNLTELVRYLTERAFNMQREMTESKHR